MDEPPRPESLRELSFGFPPSDPLSPKRQHTADLAGHLERHGLRVKAVFGTDYRSLVEDLVAGRLDAAWLAPLSLLRAERQVRPVLALQRAGQCTYHGALVARRDSGLVGVRDLAGKRVGWVDEDSAAGCVLTRALISEQYRNIDAFLGPQQMLGSHRAVVEAVLAGQVDVGATFMNFGREGTVVQSGWQEFLGERAQEVAPIAITGSIPGDVIAVRHDLPREDNAALGVALRELATDADGRALFSSVFGAEAFVDLKPTEHEMLAEQARRAGWRP